MFIGIQNITAMYLKINYITYYLNLISYSYTGHN